MNKLNVAISHFIFHCKHEKNLSPKTIKFYSIDLKQFLKFIEASSKECVEEIDKIILKDYLKGLEDFKAKTIKRKIATVKALFNYLEFEDMILLNPFRKLRIQIKSPIELPKTMNIEEIKEIFTCIYKERGNIDDKSCTSYKEKTRDIAIIELLFATGARVSEISNLTIDAIDLRTWTIKLSGKGRKERIIQLCDSETKEILNEYYEAYKSKMEKASRFFFINRLNKPLSEQSIRFLVKNLSKKAGIEKHITPHCFRHTFATLLLESNVDIKYIQHLLGHSSILTTQIYTHVNSEKQREILTDRHPRGAFRVAIN